MECKKYYQNEPNFSAVYSRNNLPKIKAASNVINLDEYKSIGTHWIALCMNGDNVTYFNSFWVEYIPKENKKFIKNKTITTNIFRIQVYVSKMCGYCCILFVDFMLKGKCLLDYTNLFSPNEYEKNDKRMLKYFFLITKTFFWE